jgi:hypothetical protein
VIIDDLNSVRVPIHPNEANTPLVVDADAHLPSFELLSKLQADYLADSASRPSYLKRPVVAASGAPDLEFLGEIFG